MFARRIILLAIAALLLVPAFVMGTTDVLVGRQNCGAALFPRDTEQLVEQSGDIIEDDFSMEIVREQCARELTRQRFFMVVFVALALLVAVAAARVRRPPERFPGDPIV